MLKELGPGRVWGPEHFRDGSWDLTFARLEWKGVRIQLAEAEGARYFSRALGRWVDPGVDFGRATLRTVLGVDVPVMPKDQLLAYKRNPDLPVDRRDLREIDQSTGRAGQRSPGPLGGTGA